MQPDEPETIVGEWWILGAQWEGPELHTIVHIFDTNERPRWGSTSSNRLLRQELIDGHHGRSGVEPHGGGPAALDRRAVAAGSQVGGGVDVEVLQGGGGGQAGEPQPAGQPAGLGGVDLDGQQPLQRGGQRQLLGGGLVEHGGQGFGRGG